MAAKLTQNGILFSDSTTVTKREWIFAAGTDFTFWASTAPTGWTKQTTHNNKALRVISGTGGGSGGSQPFTTVCSPTFKYAGTLTTSTSTGGHRLTYPEISSHAHPEPGRYTLSPNPASYNPAGQFTGWTGGDIQRSPTWTRGSSVVYSINPDLYSMGADEHNHPVSASGPVNTTFSLGVYYLDMIVCSFDG